MKIKVILLMLFLCSLGYSQYGEFETYSNGLIYSEGSISKLKKIVDSLNLKFKVCEYNKKFKSVNQTKANYIRLDKKKVLEAKKDFDNNISFEEFIKKYPKAIVETDMLIMKFKYFDEYDKVNRVEVSSMNFNDNYRHTISNNESDVKEIFSKPVNGKWLYDYQKKTDYSDERIVAFYFIEDFKSKVLTQKYSKLIQYSECMIDTNASIYKNEVRESGRYYYDTIPRKYQAFNNYIDEVLKRPNFSMEDFESAFGLDTMNYEKPWKKLKLSKNEKSKIEERRKLSEAKFDRFQKEKEYWFSKRNSRLDSLKINDQKFLTMLSEAYDEAKNIKSSDDEFEEYVGLYISKDAALELKRNRKVIGGCSMDQSPRIHAFNIALLSAETTKWEIFLRSHLNIMNDRFDRVSDGSYAQAGRKTYIKELEILDINVLDLIIGISLRIENPSENNYYGSINRIGRALAESKNKNEVETMILDMIADNELDDYNRVLMYFLFDNYNYSIEDKIVQKENYNKLKVAVAKLPDYISSKIEIKNL